MSWTQTLKRYGIITWMTRHNQIGSQRRLPILDCVHAPCGSSRKQAEEAVDLVFLESMGGR